MFEKPKHETIEHEPKETLEEMIARTYSTEAVEDLRDILINGIQHNDMLKRTLEMFSVHIKAAGRIPDDLDKDGNFITACDCGEVNEILVFLLYFITQGNFGNEIQPYEQQDLPD